MLASVVFRTSIPPQVIAVQLHQVERTALASFPVPASTRERSGGAAFIEADARVDNASNAIPFRSEQQTRFLTRYSRPFHKEVSPEFLTLDDVCVGLGQCGTLDD
jgi:hypothetical protein